MRRVVLRSEGAILAIVLVLMAAVMLLSVMAEPVHPAPVGLSVSGTVREVGGAAITEAHVDVAYQTKRGGFEPLASISPVDGNWSFMGRTGTYRFTFSAPGAETLTLVRTYDARGSFTLDAGLECYGTLSGVVRSAATNEPVQEARVAFYRQLPDGMWPAAPTTETVAPDGAYTSPPLVTGAYAIAAEGPGYPRTFLGGDVPTAVNVTRGQTVEAPDIPLEEPDPPAPPVATISGRIFGADGVNGLHGYVYFFKQNEDLTWPTTYVLSVETSANGSYVSPPLELGTYKVRLFTVHTGSQWWRYQPTYALGWPIVLDTPGQVFTGVDAQIPAPVP